jgi:hypothetical protein
MRVSPAGALLLLALAGCSAPSPKGPCEGLVYTDAGLTREQYAPCAKAMVAKVDELWQDVQALHDEKRSRSERMRARQHCMATASEAARMWKQAGGTSKLVSLAWYDTDLNHFNYNVMAARESYFVYCYYGTAGPGPPGMEGVHVDARRFAATLR